MVKKCIVVGCDSGYKRKGEIEKKIKFFYVPNNNEAIKKWQIAINRNDYKVKAGDAVCAKHFEGSDIIHEKLIKNTDGDIIGTVKYIILIFVGFHM